MAKQKNNNEKTKTTQTATKKKKSNAKKTNKKTTKTQILKEKIANKKHNFLMGIVIFSLGVLLTFSTYAWLSTSLNVQIKNFSMVVSRNSGLSISLDGIEFGKSVEISEEILINQLKNRYPTNTSQWSANGLVPVSTNGIAGPNSSKFNVYGTTGVKYKNRKKEKGYVTTYLMDESNINAYNFYIAFDIFIQNATGSPVADNLYLDGTSYFAMESEYDEEMDALVNSARIGIVKMGTVSSKAPVNQIQGIQCNNACQMIIYEPNSKNHNPMSVEKATKYGINLVDGEYFPTYGCIKAGGPIIVNDSISGSTNMDYSFFALQNTITDEELEAPIFKIPDGITKFRVYVWIEGQDIDSLETDSSGADVAISIDLSKDTLGYEAFN